MENLDVEKEEKKGFFVEIVKEEIKIYIYALCLIISISIVLLVVWKWNKENHQPSLRESMKGNIKEAKEILNDGKEKKKTKDVSKHNRSED